MVAQAQQDQNNGSDCREYCFTSHIVQRIPGSRGLGEWIASSAVSELSHYQPLYIRRRGHSSFLNLRHRFREINDMNGISRFFIAVSMLAAGIPASAGPVQVCQPEKFTIKAKTNTLIDSQATER